MALDLTLCLVPKQIEALFLKAINNANYAEWIPFIPALLKDPDYRNYQDEDLIQLKKDVAALKEAYQFTDEHYFYDSSRASSTIDYLLNKHIQATNSSIQPSIAWDGGNKFYNVTAGQGMPIRLYNREQIEDIFTLLVDLGFSDLLVHYDYEKMQKFEVYKLTRPESLLSLERAFYGIRAIFLLALTEDLLVFKKID